MARLSRAQEEERRRISRELHDQMGQHLTAFSLGLKALEGRYITESAQPATLELIGHLRGITAQMGRDIHHVAVSLRPTALDDLGLLPALRAHAEFWQESHGIRLDVEVVGDLSGGVGRERLPESVETVVYRTVQEALTNVARHASGATLVSVTLQRRDGWLLVTVEDNGQGFDVEAATHSGRLGVLGMRERAEQVGGTLEVESVANKGTTLFLRVPLIPQKLAGQRTRRRDHTAPVASSGTGADEPSKNETNP